MPLPFHDRWGIAYQPASFAQVHLAGGRRRDLGLFGHDMIAAAVRLHLVVSRRRISSAKLPSVLDSSILFTLPNAEGICARLTFAEPEAENTLCSDLTGDHTRRHVWNAMRCSGLEPTASEESFAWRDLLPLAHLVTARALDRYSHEWDGIGEHS